MAGVAGDSQKREVNIIVIQVILLHMKTALEDVIVDQWPVTTPTRI